MSFVIADSGLDKAIIVARHPRRFEHAVGEVRSGRERRVDILGLCGWRRLDVHARASQNADRVDGVDAESDRAPAGRYLGEIAIDEQQVRAGIHNVLLEE